jgi:adenylosuccinate lyase
MPLNPKSILTSWDQKPIWDEVDVLLDPKLFIGRSAEQVERYAGPNGVVDKKLEKYKGYIVSSATAELSV